MRVRVLQEHLSKLDPNLEVFCYTEDEVLVAGGRSGFLEIEAIDTAEGERFRNEQGVAGVRFGKGNLSETFVIIEVTTDF